MKSVQNAILPAGLHHNLAAAVFSAETFSHLNSIQPRHFNIQKQQIQMPGQSEQFSARGKKMNLSLQSLGFAVLRLPFPSVTAAFSYRHRRFLYPFVTPQNVFSPVNENRDHSPDIFSQSPFSSFWIPSSMCPGWSVSHCRILQYRKN